MNKYYIIGWFFGMLMWLSFIIAIAYIIGHFVNKFW